MWLRDLRLFALDVAGARKVSAIVRQEMDAAGALETLLPQLQPAELWQRSGRWSGYTAGEGICFTCRIARTGSLAWPHP